MQASLALAELPEQADETQQQRQAVEHILAFTFQIIRHQFQITANEMTVNETYSCYPVTGLKVTVLVLYVILAAGEIPHEITPVHEVHLITEEELQILQLGGYDCLLLVAAGIIDIGLALDSSSPVLVVLDMLTVPAVHTREEHVLCIDIVTLVILHVITVLLIGTGLLQTSVGLAFGDGLGSAVVAVGTFPDKS